MVCRWAGERAARERNTTIRLWIGSGEGSEDTKGDGSEESKDEIHIEKTRFRGSKVVGVSMIGLPPSSSAA